MDSIQEETEQNEQPPQAVREEATRARRRLAISSIRTKTTLLTVCAIIAAMAVATLLGATAIRNIGTNDSRQMLLLLCEAGEKNLDYYFESVEQSVEMVAAYVEEDLNTVDREQLPDHLARVKGIFARMAHETNGVLTYYYRIDPEYSEEIKGFWFVNVGGQDFREHAVTDITRYDTEDTSALVWFTMPKSSGKPIWLPPYITDNLGARVISYNVPVYQNGQFVGVVGIEIDYSTMAEQVDSIRLYSNGYAFLSNAQGELFYHPRIDVTQLTEETIPPAPGGLVGDSTFVQYRFDGVEKTAAWLPPYITENLDMRVISYNVPIYGRVAAAHPEYRGHRRRCAGGGEPVFHVPDPAHHKASGAAHRGGGAGGPGQLRYRPGLRQGRRGGPAYQHLQAPVGTHAGQHQRSEPAGLY